MRTQITISMSYETGVALMTEALKVGLKDNQLATDILAEWLRKKGYEIPVRARAYRE